MQACGSGGTTAGLALGNHLGGMGATVHAYGVCDDEEYFYDFIDGLYKLLGATPDRIGRLAGLPWVPRTPAKPQLFCQAGMKPGQMYNSAQPPEKLAGAVVRHPPPPLQMMCGSFHWLNSPLVVISAVL